MIERINLIPAEIKLQRLITRARSLSRPAFILFVLVLAAIYIYQNGVIRDMNRRLLMLESERGVLINQQNRYREILDKTRLLQKREADIKKRVEIIYGLLEYQIQWSAVLKFLSNNMPKKIWLTSLSSSDVDNGESKKIMQFAGTSMNNSAIAEFIFILENSRYFDNVNLGYSQKRDMPERVLFDFEISTEIKASKSKAFSEVL
jgi:Tfp pilus assembly protein PilN